MKVSDVCLYLKYLIYMCTHTQLATVQQVLLRQHTHLIRCNLAAEVVAGPMLAAGMLTYADVC